LRVVTDQDFALCFGREAVLQGIDYHSVTISPMLTASLDTAPPAVASTLIESGRRSPIIEAARLAHSYDLQANAPTDGQFWQGGNKQRCALVALSGLAR
jgi:hypothetical protein